MLSQSRSILSSTVSSQPSAVSRSTRPSSTVSRHTTPQILSVCLPCLSCLHCAAPVPAVLAQAGTRGCSCQGFLCRVPLSFIRNGCSTYQSAIINQKSKIKNPPPLFDFRKRIPSFPPTCIQYSGSGSKTTSCCGGKYSNFFRYEERITPSAFSSFLSSHRFYRLGQGIV